MVPSAGRTAPLRCYIRTSGAPVGKTTDTTERVPPLIQRVTLSPYDPPPAEKQKSICHQLTIPKHHNIVMLLMKTATVRDLRYNFPRIEAWLGGGQEVLITKHAKPLAKLTPQPETPKRKLEHPDYEARLKRIWGNRVFTAAEVEEMRAFETGEP